jgi:7-cyano-7-deazaguanine synthase
MSSVVLASGGLDSITNLYEAKATSNVILALTFDYGQRAAAREAEAAEWHCKKLNIPHRVLDVRWFREFTKTSLVDRSKTVPSEMSLDDNELVKKTAEAVWVPNRNGILLNIGAGYAEGLGAKYVVPGFNREEASTFPDNSQGFINSLNTSFSFSTNGRVQVKCFTTDLNKVQIVGRALALGIELDRLWPCYHDGSQICGQCESCLRFGRAVQNWKDSKK